MILLIASLALPGFEVPPSWAEEVQTLINKKYVNPNQVAAYIDAKGKPSRDPAFAWDMGVLLSAYAQGLKVDPKSYGTAFSSLSDILQGYWTTDKRGSGFAVLPHQNPPDRFYDDNAWIALAYVEAFSFSHNRKWLRLAVDTHRFVESAESLDLGGGLFWQESPQAGKNVCINAPATLVALKLYQQTREAKYLAEAKRWLLWTRRLQDTDGLYFDNEDLKGKIDRTKWSYNSALMIRNHLALYEIERNPSDLAEAKRIGFASLKFWVKSDGRLADEASFAHHLSEAWIDLAAADPTGPWASAANTALAKAHAFGRNPEGLFGLRWDRPDVRQGQFKLLYQASALRGFLKAVDLTRK